MNFKPKTVARTEPVLNMKQLAQAIDYEADAVANQVAFAPPAIRNASAEVANQIKSFGDLPTTELDAIVSAAKAEIAALELDAQAIRDMYCKHTQRVAADIKRLQEGVKLSMETMKALREQCAKLDEPSITEPPKPEPEKEVGNDRSPG